jgi:hypothetical protein
MAQRKLICQTSATADGLKARIAKHRPGRQFVVYGVSMGYQVVEIRKFGGYGYSWDGTTWAKAAKKPWLSSTPVSVETREVLTTTVSLPFSQETKAYIGALVNGAVSWFGKGTICAYAIVDGVVSLTLPAKIAAKRGLV